MNGIPTAKNKTPVSIYILRTEDNENSFGNYFNNWSYPLCTPTTNNHKIHYFQLFSVENPTHSCSNLSKDLSLSRHYL